jgi:hypothetical protein
MPLDSYNGDTFVSFVDISGFREMTRDRAKAIRALDNFYQAGYDILKSQTVTPRVDGLFVSDCGILFVRSTNNHNGSPEHLKPLLRVIEDLNRRLLTADIMLTCSVAFGPFTYEQRLEFPGIEKNPLYGNAYLAAYLDSASGRPKIQPGQTRIVCEGLPESLHICDADPRLAGKRGAHRYFYWMVSTPADISGFEERYAKTFKLKYQGMLDSLRDAASVHVDA